MAAFATVPGYGNLPNGYFSPTIYSQKVQKYFRKSSVAEDITNTDYFGEIANFGDTVNIIKEPVLTVSALVRGQALIAQDLVDDQLTLTVDQANYFMFKVDDIEEKQSHVNWESLAIGAAAYKLKDTFDTDILSYIKGQVSAGMLYGTSAAPLDVGFAAGEVSPLSVMNRLSRLLDVNNVPSEGRWLVADPVFWEQVGDENSKLLMDWSNSKDGATILRNGLVSPGEIRGFKCYKSNNTPMSTATVRTVLAGHISSTATASQIAKTESYRDPNSFADIVRGMHMYGRKVLRTDAIAASHYTVD